MLAIAWVAMISMALATSFAVAGQSQHEQQVSQQKVKKSNKPKFNVTPQQIEGRRQVGQISIDQNQTLEPGDVVIIKMFDRWGRVLPEQVKVAVKSSQLENQKSWAYELANEINHNLVGVRAGEQTELGIIAPSQTRNVIYASADSVVHSVETVVQKGSANNAKAFSVDNLDEQVPFNEQGTHVSFDVNSKAMGTLTAKLFDENNVASGSLQQQLSPGSQNMSLRIAQPNVGKYRLQLTFKSNDGVLSQQQHTITVTNNETDV